MAVTTNSMELDLAKLARVSTAGNPDVKQFATTMITDHSAGGAQATALATKLGVTPNEVGGADQGSERGSRGNQAAQGQGVRQGVLDQ